MRTENYNPSILEVELTNALSELENELEARLTDNTIESITTRLDLDNPTVLIKTRDKDGDPHEIVLKIIQRPDKF